MRCLTFVTILAVSFLIIAAKSDKKFNTEEDTSEKLKKVNKNKKNYDFDGPEEKNNKFSRKVQKNNSFKHEVKQEPKKFIGRIEHGKVMVLRRKEDKFSEDYSSKVCSQQKNGCKYEHDDDEDSSEETKNNKKGRFKFSLKFRHEKLQKREPKGDVMSVLRLHKNGRRNNYEADDDDETSEEDDKPIKRFKFVEDED
ncbi:hypothetical protein ABEB36_001622 [Hypothenemus hampei]|uniref:Uncharacterized protein n=1 Tax=Hypothenemus hampei TaxID=57062 RepID=A0ABD1FIP6_HYPHA